MSSGESAIAVPVPVQENGPKNEKNSSEETTSDPDQSPFVALPKVARDSGYTELGPVLDRDTFHYTWDTQAYLQDFFANVQEPAMQLILHYLPAVATRLPKGGRLCDLGCGPTIHVSVIFRHYVEEIFMADYLPGNRSELVRWLKNQSKFDWGAALRHIAPHECLLVTDENFQKMQNETRQKVKGIIYCDVHDVNLFANEPAAMGGFDVITCTYTIEYCCNTETEYRAAIRNIARFIKPGGYFVYGGVMEETWCSFGGKQFTCLYVTLEFVIDCFKHAGIDTDPGKLLIFNNDGIILLVGQKLSTKEYAQRLLKVSEAQEQANRN